MKRFVIFAAAAMLAMTGVANAGNTGYDDDGKCKGGSYCDDGSSGGAGGAGGAGGDATAGAIGVGVGIAGANSSSSANAGALAGAAVLGSGNADVDVKNTNTALGGAVVGSGNSDVDVRNTSTNTNLNAVSNDVRNTNAQGQLQGQLQGQQQVATGGSSSSVSQGGSINISGGGEGSEGGTAPFSSNVTVAEGAVQNSNTNTSTSSATGGAIEAGAVVNNVTVQQPEGNNGIQIESGGSLGGSQASGDETQVEVDARTFNENKTVIPVASAAPSFSSICSSGAGGQAKDWGFSVAVTNAVCQHLMMADAFMALGDREKAIKHVYAAERHANVKGFMNYILHVGTLGIL
jgi:hypothetical protein